MGTYRFFDVARMSQHLEKDILSMDDEELRLALVDSQEKFDRATREIGHLDDQINYLRKLFRRAEKNNSYAVRYNLRMQLSTTSGVKVMYHHFAAMMESRINNLTNRIDDLSMNSSPTSEEAVDDGTEL